MYMTTRQAYIAHAHCSGSGRVVLKGNIKDKLGQLREACRTILVYFAASIDRLALCMQVFVGRVQAQTQCTGVHACDSVWESVYRLG